MCEIRTMPDPDTDPYIRWIREGLAKPGKTQIGIAKALGIAHPQITRLLQGERDLKVREIRPIAEYLETPPPLPGERWPVPVVGYVGAGAQVYPVDDHAKGAGLEVVDLDFPMPREAVAVIVRGESMLPTFEDGALIGYYGRNDDPTSLIGRLCIAQVVDGPLYIKRLRRGSAPGLFTLVSPNASDIEDVRLSWASPFRFHLSSTEWRPLTR